MKSVLSYFFHFTVIVLLCVVFLSAGSRAFGAAQVDEFSDIEFGSVPPTAGNLREESEFCVALENRGLFSLIGTGSGPGGQFGLTSDTGNILRYQVFFAERGGGLGTPLQSGVPLSGLRGRDRLPNGRCPQPMPRVTVEIPAATLLSARPGRYRGSLSLMVVPE